MAVEEQEVSDGRFNVLATLETPHVVFSTHFDCVPPFFPSRILDGRLYGRGACDAKGILAAQVTAAERLRQSGVRDLGMLFVVGEERGSDGAKAANPRGRRMPLSDQRGADRQSSRPAAHRGAFRVQLSARGRAAHSSYPEAGESAIEKLVDALVRLRGLELPTTRCSAARTTPSASSLEEWRRT